MSDSSNEVPAKQQLACPKCGEGRLYISDAEFQTYNTPKLSLVMFVHEGGYTCNKCDQYFVAGIDPKSVAFQPVIMPAERPKEASVIVSPPPGLKIVGH